MTKTANLEYNIEDAWYFQILKSTFPAFDSLDRHYTNNDPGLIYTNKNDWPFEGILARYIADKRDAVLFPKEIGELELMEVT